MEISLAIIGTAGRKEDGKKLSKKHFAAMCVIAEALMDQLSESNYTITHAVSGGAAWADHVAVRLFLDKKVPNLRLFLPDYWEDGTFHDTGERDPFRNPGGTANYYHKLFLNSTGIHSLSEIQIAKMQGAELIDRNKRNKPFGFYARNALVSNSDFLLACTFGNKHEVSDGGTADTVNKYLTRCRKEDIFDKSFHYDLTSGKVYEGCTVPPSNEENIEVTKARIVNNRPLIQNFGLNPNKVVGMHFYPP